MFSCGLVIVIAVLAQAWVAEPPRGIVTQATRAIEGDSLAGARKRWSERVARDSADRVALLGLATLARLTFDYDLAERYYAPLVPPEGGPTDRVGVYALLGDAHGLATRAMLDPAVHRFLQAAKAARSIGDSAAEAEALIGLAVPAAPTQGDRASDSLFKRAARVMPPADSALRAQLHCARAGPPRNRGELPEKQEARRGIDLARLSNEPRIVAFCLLSLAKAHFRLGEIDSARQAGTAAAELQRATRHRAALAGTLQWRGYALLTNGEYGLARRDLVGAIDEGRASGNLAAVALASLHLTAVSLRFGDVVSAGQFAREADSLLSVQGNRRALITLRGLQGDIARALDDTPAARRNYQDAISEAVRLGGYPTMSPHRSLATLARKERDWNTARLELLSASVSARMNGMTEWEQRLSYDYAALALAQGDLRAAKRALERFLQSLGATERGRGYAARVRLAEIRARQGDLAGAEADLDEAIAGLETQRAELDDAALRVLVFQQREDDVDPDLGIATVIARMVEGGRAEAAFHLTERRRARELLDRMIRLQTLGTAYDTTPTLAADLRRRRTSVTSAEVAAALPSDSIALLEYVTGHGDEPTTLFIVRRGGVLAYVLPPIDSLSDDVERFTALTQSGSGPPSLANRLGDALLARAAAGLPAAVNALLVVPDERLYSLPFDALPLADGRPALDRFTVSMVPSATIAVELWRQPGATGATRILAMGDPRFPGELPAVGGESESYRSAFAATGGLPRLGASGDEVRRVARFAPSATVRVRDAASEAYLSSASLRRFRILHFATHALVDEQAVTRTALALAPGEGKDGFVTPADLAALDLDADLVVLSACRTAGGVVVGGEGVQGLTAPLLQAGARAVVATVWPVGDQRTVRFVEDFYLALARGMPVGQALRAAKLASRDRAAPPSEWAAFTLVGDPTVHIPLAEPHKLTWRWIIVLFGAAIAVVLAWRLHMIERDAD